MECKEHSEAQRVTEKRCGRALGSCNNKLGSPIYLKAGAVSSVDTQGIYIKDLTSGSGVLLEPKHSGWMV